MRQHVIAAFAVLGLVSAAAPQASAQGASDPRYIAVLTTDAPRAADIPWLGRYGGSHLVGQTVKAFDELALASGPAQGRSFANDKKFAATLTVQGRVTRTAYLSPTGRSSLEVFTNYREAALKAGYAPVFECANEACGESFPILKYNWQNKATQPQAEGYEQIRQLIINALFDRVLNPRYVLMAKPGPQGDSHVAIYAALNRGGSMGSFSDLINDRVSVLVEVVEPRSMDRSMVVVSAEEIGSKLGAEGRAVFYGIQFDTDKADIKPDSQPQIEQMVAFLTRNANARVYVIGHTDNQGRLDYNLGLSNRRAEALVRALVSRGINPTRLVPRGLGPLAPVATNRTDDGRAQNRRVELVEQ
jgi:outer membrane protein OmpA-like peptidoglycan-associated protein